MIDMRQLLSGLVSTVGSEEFPDINGLATRLSLDVSRAKIGPTKRVECINNALFKHGGPTADITWGILPRRSIWVLFQGSSIPYESIKDEVFGTDQKIQPSKYGAGFSILFEVDGWRCGYTVDSEASDIRAVFCESLTTR
jgi:hypothetical protein